MQPDLDFRTVPPGVTGGQPPGSPPVSAETSSMHVTARVDYALQAMLALAHTEDEPVPSKALADMLDLSYGYLLPIVNELRRAGLVRLIRGDGFLLARRDNLGDRRSTHNDRRQQARQCPTRLRRLSSNTLVHRPPGNAEGVLPSAACGRRGPTSTRRGRAAGSAAEPALKGMTTLGVSRGRRTRRFRHKGAGSPSSPHRRTSQDCRCGV